jgi:hypothetical protein
LYEIAYHLKTPVFKLNDMPYDEFLGWIDYFARRPPDWRDDDRAWKIMQASGAKGDAKKIFPSLAAVFKRDASEGALSTLKGSALFHKMLSAKGGDTLDL